MVPRRSNIAFMIRYGCSAFPIVANCSEVGTSISIVVIVSPFLGYPAVERRIVNIAAIKGWFNLRRTILGDGRGRCVSSARVPHISLSIQRKRLRIIIFRRGSLLDGTGRACRPVERSFRFVWKIIRFLVTQARLTRRAKLL